VVIYLDDKPAGRPGITLLELLRLAGRDPALTVVTVDGKFVPRSDYKNLVLPDGARVKALELLGGG
jgi:thiamine biosynthesis protein ThiS